MKIEIKENKEAVPLRGAAAIASVPPGAIFRFKYPDCYNSNPMVKTNNGIRCVYLGDGPGDGQGAITSEIANWNQVTVEVAKKVTIEF